MLAAGKDLYRIDEMEVTIKEKMYCFSMEELESMEKLVDDISEKRKAKNELV